MTTSPTSCPYVSLTRLKLSMSAMSTERRRLNRAADATFCCAASSMARLLRSAVRPSVVAIVSSLWTMRAFERLTARWLARTSSVGRTESPNAWRRLAPRMSVPSARSCMRSGRTRRLGCGGQGIRLLRTTLCAPCVLAAVGQRAAVLHDHRHEPGVLREANADEVVDFTVAALGCDHSCVRDASSQTVIAATSKLAICARP